MKEKKQIKGVIVVLGSPNDAHGNLLSIARERCSRAFEEFNKHTDYAVLPTGGWGQHFNTTDKPHCFYVKQELMELGIPESAFLPGTESSNTIEDAKLSVQIMDSCPEAELVLVTSDFHSARVRFLFSREFPDRRITMSESTTVQPPEVLSRLRKHEKKALENLSRNK